MSFQRSMFTVCCLNNSTKEYTYYNSKYIGMTAGFVSMCGGGGGITIMCGPNGIHNFTLTLYNFLRVHRFQRAYAY